MTGERTMQALLQALIFAALLAIGQLLTYVSSDDFRRILEGDAGLLTPLILEAITFILTFIKKYLGGITTQADTQDGVRSTDRRGVRRPNLLAL